MQAKLFLLFSATLASAVGMFFGQAPSRTGSNAVAPAEFLPYTAKFKITFVQVQTNGTTTTQVSNVTEARDSHGRTVAVTTTSEVGANGASFTVGQIRNRATGDRTDWDSRKKIARILKEPPPEHRHGCWRAESGLTIYYSGSSVDASTPLGPTQREDLGTSKIEGVEVHGDRLRTTIPVGRIGNDQPIVYVSETWYAASLGLVLRSDSENPPTGKHGEGKKELTSLDLAEPDPTLFRPPAGYQVVPDEMAPCKK